MDAGYFPSTYFGHEYFPVGPQYFPEGGAAAPATPSTPSPGKGMLRRVAPIKREPNILLLNAIYDYLQFKTEEPS